MENNSSIELLPLYLVQPMLHQMKGKQFYNFPILIFPLFKSAFFNFNFKV